MPLLGDSGQCLCAFMKAPDLPNHACVFWGGVSFSWGLELLVMILKYHIEEGGREGVAGTIALDFNLIQGW